MKPFKPLDPFVWEAPPTGTNLKEPASALNETYVVYLNRFINVVPAGDARL